MVVKLDGGVRFGNGAHLDVGVKLGDRNHCGHMELIKDNKPNRVQGTNSGHFDEW